MSEDAQAAEAPTKGKGGLCLKGACALIVLAGVAAMGGFGYLEATKVERHIRYLSEEHFDDDAHESAEAAKDALSALGDDPRVHAFFREQVLKSAADPNTGYSAKDLARLDAVFAAQPMKPDARTFAALVMVWLRFDHKGALAWAPGFETAAEAVPGLEGAFLALGQHTYLWSERYDRDEAQKGFLGVLAELERREATDSDRFVEGVTAVWARRGFPKAQAYVDQWSADPRMPQALAVHLDRTSKEGNYSRLEGEYERIFAGLSKGTPKLTNALVDGMARACGGGIVPGCAELARKLNAGETLRKRSNAISDEWGKRGALLLTYAVGHGSLAEVDHVFSLLFQLGGTDRYKAKNEGIPPQGSPMNAKAIDFSVYRYVSPGRLDRFATALVGFGPKGVEPIVKHMQTKEWRVDVQLCARALWEMGPDVFLRELDRLLLDYAPLARKFLVRGAPEDEPTLAVERRDLRGKGTAIAECLRLAASKEGDRTADYALMHALSCPDTAVSQFATARLKERLEPAAFVDVFFAFLGVKAKFAMWEVERYESALLSTEGVAGHVVRNLEALLKRFQSPARVPWIHKVIAMRCLKKVGTKDAQAVIGRYAADPDSFFYTDTRFDSTGKVTKVEKTEVKFADLAKEAGEAISKAGR